MPLVTRRRVHIAAASATVQLLWGAGSVAQEPRGDPQIGHATAVAMCANCHLVGGGQARPAMDSVPSFDALARDPAMTESRLRGFLNRPHPPMPDPQLMRQEIDNIVSYILELRRRGG